MSNKIPLKIIIQIAQSHCRHNKSLDTRQRILQYFAERSVKKIMPYLVPSPNKMWSCIRLYFSCFYLSVMRQGLKIAKNIMSPRWLERGSLP